MAPQYCGVFFLRKSLFIQQASDGYEMTKQYRHYNKSRKPDKGEIQYRNIGLVKCQLLDRKRSRQYGMDDNIEQKCKAYEIPCKQ
mgnify:CR=1 FL=1